MITRSPSSCSLRDDAEVGGGHEVDSALEPLFAEGRQSWPALPLSFASFARHVARHAPERSTPQAHLPALYAADLYLACACNERLPGSVEALLARYGGEIEAALRSRNVPPDQREELGQEIWEKLFVGRPGAPPKIGDYAGRGPLGGWLRVAALRAALNSLKQRKHERLSSGREVDEAAHPTAPDPELAFLQSQYRDEVFQALKDALAGLPADERNVLRLYFLDGLSIDKIAAVYAVHRATAARWVTRGREALLKGTQDLLGQRFRLDQAEVASLVGLVRSQLDVTLSSLFRAASA